MTTDQKMLYRSCRDIIDGKWTSSLELATLGPVNHARWITLALRLNYLYMSTPNPSEEIVRLAWFVVTIYAVIWFLAKRNWKAHQAPELVFRAMKLIHRLPLHKRRILCPVFERGFLYWMHPEQLLLGCIASDDPDVRSRAVARIIQTRSVRSESSKGVVGKKRGRKPASTVRVLELPNPIYSAKDFTSMIDWSKSQVTEPPVLRDLSEEDIKAFQTTPFTCIQPSNTQFVERSIQLIAKNGTRSASQTLRSGHAHATLESQERRSGPGSTSKAAYAK